LRDSRVVTWRLPENVDEAGCPLAANAEEASQQLGVAALRIALPAWGQLESEHAEVVA
jgi:hypothetical protein